MQAWKDVYLHMLEELEQYESRLTDWERGFVEGLNTALEQDRPLSSGLIEILEQIHDRVVGG